MEKKIHTVLGTVDPSELLFTQCHEHLLLSKGRSFQVNPVLCIDDLEKSVQETKDYFEAGGRGIVEAQPVGCSRVSEGLTEISRRTGVHIIASTGFHKLQFYPKTHWIRVLEEKQLARIYLSELTEGMYTETDRIWKPEQKSAKAGIIKTALDACNLKGQYETLFRAAAWAQAETGAPIMVHIEKGSRPELLIDFFRHWGTDPEKVYFCHMDRACETSDDLKRVLDAGISLEFDTIGRFKYHSDEAELDLIKGLLDQGYEDQILFSLDTTRARLKAYEPSAVGLTYILKTFLPKMRNAGVTENQIQKISIANPRKILAW